MKLMQFFASLNTHTFHHFRTLEQLCISNKLNKETTQSILSGNEELLRQDTTFHGFLFTIKEYAVFDLFILLKKIRNNPQHYFQKSHHHVQSEIAEAISKTI
jgi:hypothetical protein